MPKLQASSADSAAAKSVILPPIFWPASAFIGPDLAYSAVFTEFAR